MEILFLGLLLWVIFSYGVTEVLPVLMELIAYALRFLFLCLWEVLKFTGKVMGWLTVHGARATCWTAAQAGLFIAILFDEWRAGPDDEEAEAEFAEDEDPGEAPDQSGYELALSLLGLAEPFTQQELSRVYRQAMKAAHTDTGGTKEAAQALNAARDLLMRRKGWK